MNTEMTWSLDRGGPLYGPRTRSLGPLENHRKTFDLRWEFLRCDEDYQKNFKRCFKNKLLGTGRSRGINFRLKYGIEPPINPSCSCEDIWRIINETRKEGPSPEWPGMVAGVASLLMPNLDKTSLIGVWGSYLEDTDISLKANGQTLKLMRSGGSITAIPKIYRNRRTINVIINLDAKAEVIDDQIKKVVTFWKKSLGIKNGRKSKRTKKKHGLQYYEELLSLFRVHEKYPNDWKRIAKVIFKSDKLDDRDRARNRLPIAKKLIEGGFRNLVL